MDHDALQALRREGATPDSGGGETAPPGDAAAFDGAALGDASANPSCTITECFRAVECVNVCGGRVVSSGCCPCAPPRVRRDRLPRRRTERWRRVVRLRHRSVERRDVWPRQTGPVLPLHAPLSPTGRLRSPHRGRNIVCEEVLGQIFAPSSEGHRSQCASAPKAICPGHPRRRPCLSDVCPRNEHSRPDSPITRAMARAPSGVLVECPPSPPPSKAIMQVVPPSRVTAGVPCSCAANSRTSWSPSESTRPPSRPGTKDPGSLHHGMAHGIECRGWSGLALTDVRENRLARRYPRETRW